MGKANIVLEHEKKQKPILVIVYSLVWSGFKPNDSCMHLPFAVTHSIVSTFVSTFYFVSNLVLQVRGFFPELIQSVLESLA